MYIHPLTLKTLQSPMVFSSIKSECYVDGFGEKYNNLLESTVNIKDVVFSKMSKSNLVNFCTNLSHFSATSPLDNYYYT